jgi:hypothetical protein
MVYDSVLYECYKVFTQKRQKRYSKTRQALASMDTPAIRSNADSEALKFDQISDCLLGLKSVRFLSPSRAVNLCLGANFV